MFRALALISFLLTPGLAAALCNGPGYTERMTDTQLAELDARAAATPFSRGLLWTAEKDGTTLTIIGTVHLPDARLSQIMQDTEQTLLASSLLLVESTLDDQSAMQVHMAENPDITILPDNMTLPSLVEDETWAAISAAASDRGLPPFMVARMQPWFISLTLAMPPCATFVMASGEPGLDNMLMGVATDHNIPVAALEPWQDMFALITAGTMDEQLEGLEMALLPGDIQDELVVSLLDFYFAGESAKGWFLTDFAADLLTGLDRDTFDTLMQEMEQKLLIDRNRAWIPVIEAAAADHEQITVAFGAAHLFGEDGVPNLLQQAGWAVTPFSEN